MKKFIKPIVIILIGGFIFFLGYLEGVGTKTSVITEKVNVPVTKTVTQTQIVTKTVPADTTEWKALKDVDDSGFKTLDKYAGIVPDLASSCEDAITAGYNNDQKTVNSDEASVRIDVAVLTGLTTDLTNEVNQRKLVLKQLGY